jgi:hypothetical protein
MTTQKTITIRQYFHPVLRRTMQLREIGNGLAEVYDSGGWTGATQPIPEAEKNLYGMGYKLDRLFEATL